MAHWCATQTTLGGNMDVMGINSSGSNLNFIKFDQEHKVWIAGEDFVEEEAFLIDPSTIQIGWGNYDGSYSWTWDEKPGVRAQQPTPDWKRAFSVWLYFKHAGPKLWRRFSWGESQGFNDMCGMIWDDIKANPGKCACFKLVGHEEKKFKIGQSQIPKFEFVKWVDKPEGFVVNDVDTVAEPAKAEADPFTNVTEDELPF